MDVPMSTDTNQRITALEQRVEALEKGRSGRRGKPILVSIEGVCGVEPSRESSTCPDASLYRRQKGCQGVACVQKSSEYYSGYRSGGTATKVAVRKRRGQGNL